MGEIAHLQGGFAADFAHHALDWLDIDPVARLIVSAHLDIVWRNAAALALFDGDHGLTVRHGQLLLINHIDNARLAGFLAGAQGGAASWNVPCANGAYHLLFKALPLAGNGRGPLIGLQILCTSQSLPVEYFDLRTIFQLTQSEHRVLLGLLNGHTAEQLAATRDLSIDTIRSHIRQIYIKVGASSREELFGKMRPYRMP